jgi:hypothetical protein
MNNQEQKYWFPAKRYGWGWGPPKTWQGWVVISAYIAGMLAVAFLFPPDKTFIRFIFTTLLLTSLTVFIAWLKGEPPRWRWGNKDLP